MDASLRFGESSAARLVLKTDNNEPTVAVLVKNERRDAYIVRL